MSGGIHRLKEHIAHDGKNCRKCPAKTPEALEARKKCKKALDDAKRKREEKTVRDIELRQEVEVSRVQQSQQSDEVTCVGSSEPHYSYSNPAIFEEPKITEGFIACVEKFYYYDEDKQHQAANIELKKFQNREGPFDKKLAKNFQNFDYNPGRGTGYYMVVCCFHLT
jgi:hypothetical protein